MSNTIKATNRIIEVSEIDSDYMMGLELNNTTNKEVKWRDNMKRLTILSLFSLVLFSLILISSFVFAADNFIKVYTIPSLNGVAIAGSGSATGESIDLSNQKPEGYFSISLITVGAGSAVKVEYLVSNDNITFTTPSGATEIVTGFTPGTDHYSFAPIVAPYLKLKVTETNGADVTSCTVSLVVQ